MRRLDYGDINKVTYFVDGLYELEENGSEKAHKIYIEGFAIVVQKEVSGEKQEMKKVHA